MGIKRKQNPIIKALMYLVLIMFSLPVIWVLWFMFLGALMPLDELKSTIGPVVVGMEGYAYWPFLPSWPTLQPLTELLLDTPEFFSMFWNSMRISLFSVLGQFLIATPAAWAISRMRFKGRQIVLVLYISLMLMPFQVTMVPNYIILNAIGLMDTPWAIIMPLVFSAFPVFIIMKGFDSIPRAMLEAGYIDGAGYFQCFLRIGLPLGVPGILSAVVLGFLESWNTIEQPLIFLRDSSEWPLSLFLPQITAERLGLSMVVSLLMLAPAMLIFLFGQKYLELGIQAAGVKE